MLQKIKLILISENLWKKIIAYGLLIAFFYWLKDFAFVFLLTFMFSYLFFILAKNIQSKLKNKFKIQNKFVEKVTSLNFIVTVIYILFIWGFLYFISHLIPLLINELSNFSKHIPIVSEYTKQITESLRQVQQTKEVVSSDFNKLMNEKNVEIVINIVNHLKHFWWELMKGLISFILSYFFIIDRKRLHKYLKWIKQSSLSFLYKEYEFLFKKIAKWFLLVFRAQAKIALTNTILTYFWLHIIWFILWQTVPYLWILTFIVFIFSFVPVLWVIISSIPISLIVYNISWFVWVIYVIIMILLIHALEAYVLNPRFISEEVELPVSLTFLILLIWEHIFWAIWLIISVPMFYIMMEILRDFDKSIRSR